MSKAHDVLCLIIIKVSVSDIALHCLSQQHVAVDQVSLVFQPNALTVQCTDWLTVS